jgi:hypothetical protein
MTQPISRDELARCLYTAVPLDREVLQARRSDWDEGRVADADRAECYAKADEMLAEGANR